MLFVCHRVQMLVISSEKVRWRKQGTCTLVDNEPAPPTAGDFASNKGWKEVKNFVSCTGGGTFLFPKDQLMVVLSNGDYKPIDKDVDRMLRSLKPAKNYMVWYHHLLTMTMWKSKQ
jgi:hypothetical protein